MDPGIGAEGDPAPINAVDPGPVVANAASAPANAVDPGPVGTTLDSSAERSEALPAPNASLDASLDLVPQEAVARPGTGTPEVAATEAPSSAAGPAVASERNLAAAFAPPPLSEMLEQMARACRVDDRADVYGEGFALQSFEAEVAALLGKPEAAFFTTGTLANIAALRAHDTRRAVLHPTSHLVHHDCLRDATVQRMGVVIAAGEMLPESLREPCFVGDFSTPLCSLDLRNFLWRRKDCIVIELPQRMNGGAAPRWEDVQTICREAKANGAKCHMDGARLWEVQPFYGVPLADLAAPFDSVYVSFYKGIGAINGAMLLGSAAFIAEARTWRARLGGTPKTFAPHWLHCREQLHAVLPSFAWRFEQLQRLVNVLSKEPLLRSWVRFQPVAPQSCMVHVYLACDQSALELAHANNLARLGLHLWDRFRGQGHGKRGEVYFEWNMGPDNALIPLEDAVAGWRGLSEELVASGILRITAGVERQKLAMAV